MKLKLRSIVAMMAFVTSLSTCSFVYAGDDFNLQAFDSDTQGSSSMPTPPSQASMKQHASQLFHRANDPVAGDPNGSVTMIEFVDYRCRHCENMAPHVDQIMKNNPNLRVVFKELPLLGDDSLYAAKAAIAAKKQGKFFELHEALVKSEKKLTNSDVIDVAKSVGLDTTKLQNDINNEAVAAEVEASMQLAKSLKLKGTPVFFVAKTNNAGSIQYFIGEISEQDLQAAINNAS